MQPDHRLYVKNRKTCERRSAPGLDEEPELYVLDKSEAGMADAGWNGYLVW